MRVAVVGATGVVGSTILEVMRERAFPADEVVPFASERSAGDSATTVTTSVRLPTASVTLTGAVKSAFS